LYRKDYILRLTEQFAKIIAYLLGLLKEEKFTELNTAVQNTWLEFIDLPFPSNEISNPQWVEQFKTKNYNTDEWELASDLLYLHAMLLRNCKDTDAIRFLKLSLLLIEEVEKNSLLTFSIERKNKIADRSSLISQWESL
jgi:hypothetical protein